MSQTDATYFLSLDDDAWFLRRDEISLGVKFLEANPDFAAVAYDILLPGDKPQAERGQPRECAIFVGCGHLLRLRDIAALRYYAPNPSVYGGSEELDLCLRLYGNGRKTIFLPGVHIWHERSATGRNVQEQFSHNLCNEFVFNLRRCPIPDFFLAVGYRLLSLFSFAARHGRIKAYFKGVFLFLQAWPQVTSSREPLSRSDFRSFMKLKRRGPY
jgi:GT2 family glycosyltransferase